jgi:hypothetical protein
MNIEERLRESERQFEDKKSEREQHLQLADECLTEMTKLQGEYRVLQELLNEKFSEPKKSNRKVNTVEAIPKLELVK